MEANEKVIEKHIYEEHDHDHADWDRVERKARNGFGMGLAGVITGGLALGNQLLGGRSLFGGWGNNGMPENVNINTFSGGQSAVAPTAFEAWEKSCSDAIALTRELFGSKINTLNDLYAMRNNDVAEKFSLWKSTVDADFGLYKSQRDQYDQLNDKLNANSFSLYKGYRDSFDLLNATYAQKFNDLDKKVAMMEAVQPYQNRLIQCEIEKAYTAAINHADRLDCRNIKGIVTLPNTPTVTGFPTSCGCNATYTTTATTA